MMPITPEELLETVPPSPSIYLDIPPSPYGGNVGDMVLPYISRILMEEDIDERFFYQYPDHPALLRAQQPFAEILNEARNLLSSEGSDIERMNSDSSLQGGCGSSMFLAGKDDIQSRAIFDAAEVDNNGYQSKLGLSNEDMLNMSFLKGMEEASKFLPRDNNLQVSAFSVGQPKEMFDRSASGRERCDGEEVVGRASKLMVIELEEDGAHEMFEKAMLNSCDLSGETMEKLHIDMENAEANRRNKKAVRGRQQGKRGDTVDLRALLLSCAQEVAISNHQGAGNLLKQIRQHASATGDATQRLAHCFAMGLEARMAGTGSKVYKTLVAKQTSAIEFLRGYELFMAACSFRRVALTFSSMTIFHAMRGKKRLHIVDYGVHYGCQWPGLLCWLASRDGGPPEVRITGIDLPQPGFRPAKRIEETGQRLSNCARQFGLPFKFHAIAAKWETIRAEDLNIEPDEVLVVNDLFNFNTLMDESLVTDRPSPRDVVLSTIRGMRPDVFIQGVVNGSSGPFFLARFREALFFHSSVFDMLDATTPRESEHRLVLERDMFGQCALNAIACEGADRVERPETFKQWHLRNQRAGLRQLPLRPIVIEVATGKVKSLYHKDFVVDVSQGWLLQGWKGRILYAHSAWVADDTSSDD
ncbi:scarecrow-like protein 9 [Brachypodium distachyon]|uniref:Uncharacterized protein n=1 Tax=Brachypodium distachyon TaxID=15368 RepID=A0A0Q3EKY5_BRADI|nr:scarecrow-like protein 9 [Brachypodium distachyon]KQJ87052.2 hypothetical protein BRADI_4g09160v3 [Brachypodium distachyon]|eukprot:XP_024319189.1 scarecrow-like protein 9 [Brachypodium distachyon]